jgi:hypothetical protein
MGMNFFEESQKAMMMKMMKKKKDGSACIDSNLRAAGHGEDGVCNYGSESDGDMSSSISADSSSNSVLRELDTNKLPSIADEVQRIQKRTYNHMIEFNGCMHLIYISSITCIYACLWRDEKKEKEKEKKKKKMMMMMMMMMLKEKEKMKNKMMMTMGDEDGLMGNSFIDRSSDPIRQYSCRCS